MTSTSPTSGGTTRTWTCASLALAALLVSAGPLPAAPEASASPAPPGRNWSGVKSWVYQLQGLNIRKLAEADADLLVIDYSRTGSDANRLTPEDLRAIQATGKLVVAYLSIGEAEPYRFYWQKGWGPGTPSWVQPANPNWPDNFPVEYWHPDWQDILMGSPESYLDKILAAGFDGVYLDIVDGYEAFQSERPTAAAEMKKLILEMARYGRARAGADFGVFPQNAIDLLEDPRYRAALTGLGKEETYFFPGDKRNPREDMEWEEEMMTSLVDDGKLVLTVDYCSRPKNRDWVRRRSKSKGFIPYLSGVDLDRVEPQN